MEFTIEKLNTIDGAIAKKMNGPFISYEKEKIIDGLRYSFTMFSLESDDLPWQMVFTVEDTFAITNKGLDTMSKVMDEVAQFISQVDKKENLKVIQLSGSAEIVLYDDVKELQTKIVEIIMSRPNCFDGFMYEDKVTDLVIENGRVRDYKLGRDSAVPLKEFFRRGDVVMSFVKDPDYCEALCQHIGITFTPKSKLSSDKDMSEQRAKLFKWALPERLPQYEVERKGIDVFLTKKMI